MEEPKPVEKMLDLFHTPAAENGPTKDVQMGEMPSQMLAILEE